MKALMAGMTGVLCGVMLTAGCGSSKDEATFDCSRGFRDADWSSSSRLKTGQSIAKCGWLDRWTEARVRAVLGRPDFGPASAPEYVIGGGRETSEQLREWILKLRFDPRSRRLTSAETGTMPI